MYKKFENLANDSETLNYKFPMPKSSAGDPTVRGFIAVDEKMKEHDDKHTERENQLQAEIDALEIKVDAEIEDRQDADNEITTKLEQEIADRTNADNALSQKIDKEIQDRTNETARLQQQITQESQTATNGINALTSSVNGLTTQVNGKLDINGIILKEKTGQDAFIAGSGTQAILAELTLDAGLHIVSGQVLAKVDANTGSLTMAITDRTDFSQIPCYTEVPFKSGAYISGNMTYLIYLPQGGTYRILARQTSGQDSINSTYFIQAIKLRP